MTTLADALDRTAVALRKGCIADLEALSAQLGAAADGLGAEDGDRDELADLSRRARRNARLIEAARKGLDAARARLEATRARDMGTYGPDGARQANSQLPSTDRRA